MQPTPDTHGLNDGGDVIPLSSRRDPDPPDTCDLALLRALVDVASHAHDTPAAAQAVLDVITEGLGLSSGTISLLQVSEEGSRQLMPTASSGPQALLLREMPPIDVDSSYEAAVVFTDSQPHYVADMHGQGTVGEQAERAEEAEQVGRWRSLLSTKSYAVLPLCAGPHPIGVMTLHWPDSREFQDHTTEMLETIAAIVAVSLDRSPRRQNAWQPSEADPSSATGGTTTAGPVSTVEVAAASTPAARRGATHTPVGPLRLEVTADGVLMPLAPEAAPSGRGLLSFEMTLADAACVVWDASAPHPGMVAVLIASFSDAETAEAMRDRLVQTKRVCARQDMTISHTFSLLNGVVLASASAGVAVPAWLGWIDARAGALTHCGVDDTDVVAHSADGRTWTPQLTAPPLGSSGKVVCREDVRLLLPGDRVMVRLGDAELRIERP